MNRRGSIIGDALWAFGLLRPESESARAAVARCLGFDVPASADDLSTEDQSTRQRPPAGPDAPDRSSKKPSGDKPPPAPSPTESPVPDLSGLDRIRPLRPVAHEPPKASLTLPERSLEKVSDTHLARIPVHLPLLPSLRARGVLSACLATDAATGDVDTDRLIDILARYQPLTEIPRLPWLSLIRGAQVLVDIGQGMEPFIRDQEEVVTAIRRWVGTSATVLQFKGCPTRGAGAGPIWSWRRYEFPGPRTPVLLLTDLGIGGPRVDPDRGTDQEWLTFSARLRRRLNPLVALVPYPPRRWPPGLKHAMAIVPWDRDTTIRKVRGANTRVARRP